MNKHDLLREFIDSVGYRAAQKVLQVSESMVFKLYSGERSLTPERAQYIHEHCNGVRYSRDALLFGRDTAA